MKTIKKDNKIKRVSNNLADKKVRDEGYTFCPKQEWKEKVRGPVKTNNESK